MKNKYIHLTGGLGNQLFQISAALSISDRQEELMLSVKNGKPRLSPSGEPDLLSFNLPENIVVDRTQKFSYFAAKASGYVLRMSASPRKYEGSRIFKLLIRWSCSLINSIYFKKLVNVFKVENVGFTNLKQNKNYLIGYFQSYKYIENDKVFALMSQFTLKRPTTEVTKYIELARAEKPIVVHVRRGDYQLEKSFGLLGNNYYEEALDHLLKRNGSRNIWVFSDDIHAAAEIFLKFSDLSIRYLDDFNNSAAHSLEVMRYGSAYVIGNSSFSWWAASLRKDRSAQVLAPLPWFMEAAEPLDLIPPDWDRIDGHHFI